MTSPKKFYLIYFFGIILPLALSFLADSFSLSKALSKNIVNLLFGIAIISCVIVLRLNRMVGNNDLSRNIIIGALMIFLLYYIVSLNSLSSFGF